MISFFRVAGLATGAAFAEGLTAGTEVESSVAEGFTVGPEVANVVAASEAISENMAEVETGAARSDCTMAKSILKIVDWALGGD